MLMFQQDDNHQLFNINYYHIMNGNSIYFQHPQQQQLSIPKDSYLFVNGLWLEQIIQNQNYLQQRVAQLEYQASDVKRQFQDFKTFLHQKNKNVKNIQKNQRKVFTKDKVCTHQNCGKRYSSKIALRAHIRTSHQRQNNDSDEFVLF